MADLGDTQSNQDIIIRGSDGTAADVTVDNRLKVDAQSSTNPRPGTFVDKQVFDMNVNGSSTPVNFDIFASTGKIFYVQRLTFTIIDNSINFEKFGGLSSLTNGIDIKTKEGGLAERPLGTGIKKNSDFYEGGLKVTLENSTKDILVLTFEFTDVNTSLKLVDSANDYIRLTVNDNLTGLDTYTMVAQGYEVDE